MRTVAILTFFYEGRQFCGAQLTTGDRDQLAIRLYEQHAFRRTPDGPQTLFGTPLVSMETSLLRGELDERE
jgi:hypothetical protein